MILLTLISTVSFPFIVATRTFKVTHVAYIIFLLDTSVLCLEEQRILNKIFIHLLQGADERAWLWWLVQAQECIYLALIPLSNRTEEEGGKGRNSTWDQNCSGQEQGARGGQKF